MSKVGRYWSGGWLGSSMVGSVVNDGSLSESLVEKMRGLKIKRLRRSNPIIGILDGQHAISSGSGPFRTFRLLQ